MKKKLLLVFGMVMFVLGFSMAQNRTITGKVISSEDESPLPGVAVMVKGTTTGAYTNGEGAYSISVPANGTLTFSFIGFSDQSIVVGNQSTINVTLVATTTSLDEIVVTGAYGTQQSARSATFSAQVIDSDKLNTVRQANFNDALAGKVAGIQVRSQSAAALGRQSEVRLRGVSGFGTGGGAIYVVDGTILPNINDINNDDIESVSVLQGPAAAAQFGSQGAEGAIVITMKKAKKQEGFGVVLNLGAQFEKAYIMPNYQNSYAGGSSSSLTKYNWKDGDPLEWQALDGKYYHDTKDDSSWGPRMVGQEYIPWYAWYGGHDKSFQTAKLLPQENNAKEFFETGVFLNNSVTINKATESLLFKMTYGNQYTNGLIPSSSLNKNTINVNAVYDISKKLELSTNINYSTTMRQGEINDGYSNQSTGAFSQWFHRDLDMGIMKDLRGLTTPDGIYASWNKENPTGYNPNDPRAFYGANYWYNPYTYYDLVKQQNQNDRLFGDISLTYKVIKGLNLKGTYRKQQNTVWSEDKHRSELNESGLQTQGNEPRNRGYYGTSNSYSNRQNVELMAIFNTKVSDFSIDGFAGADFFRAKSNSNSGNTNQGLNVPNLFTLANSVNAASQNNSRSAEAYNAIFAKANFGYKNFLFLNGTLRKDWYSTLPAEANGVVSKSIGASFVFTDFTKEALPWLSLGKIRGSWGEIPKALGTNATSFGAFRYPGMAYGVGQYKWGSNFLMGTPDQVVDPRIRGSVTSQKEIGIDLEFFKGKYGISATLWDGSEVGFPYALTVNGASGFSSLLTNIGKIEKKGFDLILKAEILNTRPVRWNATFTYSDLMKNDVVELSKEYEITRTANQGGAWGTNVPYMLHEEGKRWGQLFGNGIKRINGVPVINEDGSYAMEANQNFGSVLPRYTGGLQNSFTVFGNFHINANIDYQFGGKFYSLSQQWGSYSGLTARTASVNDKGFSVRDAVENGGGVRVEGVNADGQPVVHYVEGQTYYQNLYNNYTVDEFIYDLTFIKLRELSVGYSLPVKKLGLSNYFKTATISVVSRNPLLLYATSKDFDPSEISAVYGETGQLPGTRSLGFNLRIGF